MSQDYGMTGYSFKQMLNEREMKKPKPLHVRKLNADSKYMIGLLVFSLALPFLVALV
jgi:hypothetical protein